MRTKEAPFAQRTPAVARQQVLSPPQTAAPLRYASTLSLSLSLSLCLACCRCDRRLHHGHTHRSAYAGVARAAVSRLRGSRRHGAAMRASRQSRSSRLRCMRYWRPTCRRTCCDGARTDTPAAATAHSAAYQASLSLSLSLFLTRPFLFPLAPAASPALEGSRPRDPQVSRSSASRGRKQRSRRSSAGILSRRTSERRRGSPNQSPPSTAETATATLTRSPSSRVRSSCDSTRGTATASQQPALASADLLDRVLQHKKLVRVDTVCRATLASCNPLPSSPSNTISRFSLSLSRCL